METREERASPCDGSPVHNNVIEICGISLAVYHSPRTHFLPLHAGTECTTNVELQRTGSQTGVCLVMK